MTAPIAIGGCAIITVHVPALQIARHRAPVIAAYVAGGVRAIRIAVGIVYIYDCIVAAIRYRAVVLSFLTFVICPNVYPAVAGQIVVRGRPRLVTPVAIWVAAIIIHMPVVIEVAGYRAPVIAAVVADAVQAIRIVMFIVNRHDRIVTAICSCTVTLLFPAFIICPDVYPAIHCGHDVGGRASVIAAYAADARTIRIGMGIVYLVDPIIVAPGFNAVAGFYLALIIFSYYYPVGYGHTVDGFRPCIEAPVANKVKAITVHMPVVEKITGRYIPVIIADAAVVVRAIRITVGIVDRHGHTIIAVRPCAVALEFPTFIVFPDDHRAVRQDVFERSPFLEAPVAFGVLTAVIYVPVRVEVARYRAPGIFADEACTIRATIITVRIVV